MTENIKNWFVPKFEDAVTHFSQQKTTRLGNTVAGGGTFLGDKVYFPRLGAVEAHDSPAFARLALSNADMDFIEVTTKPKYVAFGLSDVNTHKYSIATATEFGRSAAAAIARAEDRSIISALSTSAVTGVVPIAGGAAVPVATIGSYADAPTMDLIAEAVAILGENETFEGEDVTVVVPWRGKVQLAMDPLMNSNQIKENLPWNDLHWRHSGLLPEDGAGGVDIFVYARSAVVSAYNDQPTKINERDGAALTDINGYWVQTGAAVRAGEGVVRIKAKKNYSLTRYAQPIVDLTVP